MYGVCVWFAVFYQSAMSTDYRSTNGGPWDVSGKNADSMYGGSCVESPSRCEPECTPLASEFPAGITGYEVVLSSTTVSGLRRSCASGFTGYPVVTCDGTAFSPLEGCCKAFSSEPSVRACSSCNGTETKNCLAATCASGFVPGSFSAETLSCTPSSCDVSAVSAPINGQLGTTCES